MFIFCRVIENGVRCNCQSWAVGSPFEHIYKCPKHGLVDDQGNLAKVVIKCPVCHKESEITNKKPVSPPEIERWTWGCGHTHLVSVNE